MIPSPVELFDDELARRLVRKERVSQKGHRPLFAGEVKSRAAMDAKLQDHFRSARAVPRSARRNCGLSS
jgi:hypothetical protein